jgi:hypothetical protein
VGIVKPALEMWPCGGLSRVSFLAIGREEAHRVSLVAFGDLKIPPFPQMSICVRNLDPGHKDSSALFHWSGHQKTTLLARKKGQVLGAVKERDKKYLDLHCKFSEIPTTRIRASPTFL